MAIQFVGRRITNASGSATTSHTISLTALTGGIGTTALEGDLVLALFATGSDTDRTLSVSDGTTEYTLIASELYSSSTYDVNLRVAYKFMGATPDTTTTFGPSGSANDAKVFGVYVFRGVDPTTPLDVAAVTATGTGTTKANPAAITPVTEGAVIMVIGAGAGDTTTFTLSGMTYSVSNASLSTNAIVQGSGYVGWTSGAFDPAQFGGGATSANYSWAAITLALRPIPTYTVGAGASGALSKAGITVGASGNAALQKTTAVTAGAGAVAVNLRTLAATANAVNFKPGVLVNASGSAALQKTLSGIASVSAALLTAFTKTLSINATLLRTTALNVGSNSVVVTRNLTNASANAIISKDGWVVSDSASPNSWNTDSAASGGWTPESAVLGSWTQ